MSTEPERIAPAATSAAAPATAASTALAKADPTAAGPPGATRADGWTRARQAEFLRELAATHCVSTAARAVGMSRQSAYQLRARLRGEPFDLAWESAFQSCFDALAEAAMERAANGVEVPHYHQGELIGTSRKYDERLTVALLSMRDGIRRHYPPYHPASAYDPHDFRKLVARVENGEETWDGRR